MYGKGKQGKKLDEYSNGHYRRFIRKDELLKELSSVGFSVEHEQEANNLSVHQDDNPWLIRVVAQNKK